MVWGIIGAMAWQFDGERLRLVWFHATDNFIDVVDKGAALTTKPLASYAKAKQRLPSSTELAIVPAPR